MEIEDFEQQPYEQWQREDTERSRRKAYADPDKGSDHLFVKALRLEAVGQDEEAQAVRQAAIERAEEIRQEMPYAEDDGDEAQGPMVPPVID